MIATPSAYRKHLGFCSRECYEHARTDGLVKVVPWDKLDYLSLGRTWRADNSKKDDIITQIQRNLDGKLAKIEWKHLASQKEEEILEC